MRQAISGIPMQGRVSTGVQLQRLDADDLVASVAIAPMADDDEDDAAAAGAAGAAAPAAEAEGSGGS